MSLQDFKQQYPDLYRQVHAKGVKSEKHRQWRIRNKQAIDEAVRIVCQRERAAADLF